MGESGAHRYREGTSGAGLNLNLGHLPRAKSDIGEELSRSGASQPDGALVLFAGLLTGEVHVGIFEDLVETVLEGTLERVTNQGRPEAFPSTGDTLFGDDGSETGYKALVLGGVDLWYAKTVAGKEKNAVRTSGVATYLHVTLGNIERGDSGVGGTASQDTTKQTLGVVGSVMGHWAEMPFGE